MKTYTYCGRDIETLSRDELLEAHRRLSDELKRDRDFAIQADQLDAELDRARQMLKPSRGFIITTNHLRYR